jgi:hypothetical protein
MLTSIAEQIVQKVSIPDGSCPVIVASTTKSVDAGDADMTATTCPTPRIALYRPWWARAAEAVRGALPRRARQTERDLFAALAGLNDKTLRDIGAPDWVHERARMLELTQLERHGW